MAYYPLSQTFTDSEIWFLQSVALLLIFILTLSLVTALTGVAWLCYREQTAARPAKQRRAPAVTHAKRTVVVLTRAVNAAGAVKR